MIKAIILDIDGIIVGEKIGYNSPDPHPDVLQKLKEVRQKGIPIILCTAKPHFAIRQIIHEAHLDNPHVTDGGAVIIDPLDNIIVRQHNIDPKLAQDILQRCLELRVYVEFYTTETYYIEKSQISEVTQKHRHILQTEPRVVKQLVQESLYHEITKIMPIACNEEEKKRVDALLEDYKDKLSISWAIHPIALPAQFCIITSSLTSKKIAVEETIKSLGIDFTYVLGVGDSTSDWNFIKLCGFGATLENGTKELKEFLKTKGEGKYVSGPSVDENGILNIFQSFHL